MSAEILGWISIVGFILSVLFAGLAIYIYFKYKILDVINDLNGKTAQREIALIKQQNAEFDSNLKKDAFYMSNDDATDEMTERINNRSFDNDNNIETAILYDRYPDNETIVLDNFNQTTVLNTGNTEELYNKKVELRDIEFKVVKSEIEIHSQEII